MLRDMSVVDISEVREAKAEKCEYCGELAHPSVFACPRIRSITYDNEDDTVTLRFWAKDSPNIIEG